MCREAASQVQPQGEVKTEDRQMAAPTATLFASSDTKKRVDETSEAERVAHYLRTEKVVA
jgi:hypothetical protein